MIVAGCCHKSLNHHLHWLAVVGVDEQIKSDDYVGDVELDGVVQLFYVTCDDHDVDEGDFSTYCVIQDGECDLAALQQPFSLLK